MRTSDQCSFRRIPLLVMLLLACTEVRDLQSVLSAVQSEFPQQAIQVTRNNVGDLAVSLNSPQPSSLDSAAMAALAWRVAVTATRALPATDSSQTVVVLLWQSGTPFAVPFGERYPIDSVRAAPSPSARDAQHSEAAK